MFGTDHTHDLRRIEAKLDLILQHLGIEVRRPLWADEVESLIRDGKRVQAVKRVRDATGRGLKEANELVEAMARGDSLPFEP